MDLINLDSQTQINEETAEEMLITLTRSNAVMIMIEEAVYGEEPSTLQNLISQNVSLEVAYAFESAIENFGLTVDGTDNYCKYQMYFNNPKKMLK